MAFWQELALAVIQGLTEFMPISSSAHLILFAEMLGGAPQLLVFDIALHLGTLVALSWYLRKDIGLLMRVRSADFSLRQHSRKLWLILLIGSVPLAVAGLSLRFIVEEYLRNIAVIASANLIFAALLFQVWKRYLNSPPDQAFGDNAEDNSSSDGAIDLAQKVSFRQAAVVGLMQVFALIPGASRAGLTLTAGLAAGLPVRLAVRLSFLLALPAILGAFLLESVRSLYRADFSPALLQSALFGACVSAVVAFFVLRYLYTWIQAVGVLPFVLYRLALGAVLLIFFVPGVP
ncbi:MAG: undecaprenyl-diphosphate phosphatase [Gammaproteobacteria bacterium]